MKKLAIFLAAAITLLAFAAFTEGSVMFEYQYNDYYVYDVGTQVCINAKYTGSSNVTARLTDEDGTVLSEKEFSSSNRQRAFVFNIPSDWTGCHMLNVYIDGEKAAEDFPVIVKEHEKVLKRVDIAEKKMAITIDCGAGGNWSCSKWLALLDEYNIKATFFITGRWASEHPDSVRAIHEAGHEIGSHSWSHCHFETLKSWDDICHELKDTNEILESLTGETPTLFRIPYGDWTYTMNTIAKVMGFTQTVQWTISSHDSDEKNSADFILSHAMPAKIENGSIVLFHCSNPAIDAMSKAIDYYINTMGFELVTVGELIPEGETCIDDDFVLRTK